MSKQKREMKISVQSVFTDIETSREQHFASHPVDIHSFDLLQIVQIGQIEMRLLLKGFIEIIHRSLMIDHLHSEMLDENERHCPLLKRSTDSIAFEEMLQSRSSVDDRSLILNEHTFDLLHELHHLFTGLSRGQMLDELEMHSPSLADHFRLDQSILPFSSISSPSLLGSSTSVGRDARPVHLPWTVLQPTVQYGRRDRCCAPDVSRDPKGERERVMKVSLPLPYHQLFQAMFIVQGDRRSKVSFILLELTLEILEIRLDLFASCPFDLQSTTARVKLRRRRRFATFRRSLESLWTVCRIVLEWRAMAGGQRDGADQVRCSSAVVSTV